MIGHGQFCAVARALEVLGERWTLLIVRELLPGPASFTDLRRGLPRIPRATLSTRLRALRNAGIVDHRDDRYHLTDTGAAVAPVIRELARWATLTDAATLSDDHLDTNALTWDIHRRVNHSALPDRTVVLALEFPDRPAADRRFYLHLSRTTVNLCREDTGAPIDLWLTAPTAETTRWWLGHLPWPQLLRHPSVHLHGPRPLQRQLPHWFLHYTFTPQTFEPSL